MQIRHHLKTQKLLQMFKKNTLKAILTMFFAVMLPCTDWVISVYTTSIMSTVWAGYVTVLLHACYFMKHQLYVCSCVLGWLHKPTNQTSQATMDSVWMKNASSPFTYSSRRKIFLRRCPLEMWHARGMRPATTLPTRFSIKQANNKIPTPINKWSFLNKVVYTEPLTAATHHNLMASCGGQSYSSPSHLYLLAEMGGSIQSSTWANIIAIIVTSPGSAQQYLCDDL